MTDTEAIAFIRRIAAEERSSPTPAPAPDPLRESLSRYLADGTLDHDLYLHDPVYHGIVALIRRALA